MGSTLDQTMGGLPESKSDSSPAMFAEPFAKVLDEGATAVTPPRRMPWGLEVAYLRVPEGTIIGLSEPSPAPDESSRPNHESRS